MLAIYSASIDLFDSVCREVVFLRFLGRRDDEARRSQDIVGDAQKTAGVNGRDGNGGVVLLQQNKASYARAVAD